MAMILKTNFDKASADERYKFAEQLLINIDYIEAVRQYVAPDKDGNAWLALKVSGKVYLIVYPSVEKFKELFLEIQRRNEKFILVIGMTCEDDD